MFRPMDKQLSLEESHFWMPDVCLDQLKVTWPHIFRTQVLPMIPETEFASLYSADMGRPNFPVAILVAMSVLKEMFDLTDEALMGSFRFALSLCPSADAGRHGSVHSDLVLFPVAGDEGRGCRSNLR